jgi:hypothetical protein
LFRLGRAARDERQPAETEGQRDQNCENDRRAGD